MNKQTSLGSSVSHSIKAEVWRQVDQRSNAGCTVYKFYITSDKLITLFLYFLIYKTKVKITISLELL